MRGAGAAVGWAVAGTGSASLVERFELDAAELSASPVGQARRQASVEEGTACASGGARRRKTEAKAVARFGRTGFQELLTLLLGTAERPELIAKVQEIQRLIEPLLRPKKTKA